MPDILILLVEDSPQDVELTLDVLQGEKLANEIYVVRDGEEALDFLFRRGGFAVGAKACASSCGAPSLR